MFIVYSKRNAGSKLMINTASVNFLPLLLHDNFQLDKRLCIYAALKAICSIALKLFVSLVLLIVGFFFYRRPRTESFMIKQHLTLAVGLTQIVLLLSIAAYRKKVSM